MPKMLQSAITIDVEDWFHILDTPTAPKLEQWGTLESRVEQNMEIILSLLRSNGVRATFFWLGWVAERNRNLLKRCADEGHEIASHGYAHVLAYQVGRKVFSDDIRHGKAVLEDITGKEVKGFRAAGFGIKDDTTWAFDEICAAGYSYDSSVFPSSRGHGGMQSSPIGCHIMNTEMGQLAELPMSVIEILGRRVSLFGGGYLRIAPLRLIRWGIGKVHKAGNPLIIYFHPREVDPDHPRLPLGLFRGFKSYVGLKSTLPKISWACSELKLSTMNELALNIYGEQQDR